MTPSSSMGLPLAALRLWAAFTSSLTFTPIFSTTDRPMRVTEAPVSGMAASLQVMFCLATLGM